MLSPTKALKSPKKKRGLFGLGKLSRSIDSDESDKQLGPGAQYTSNIGHQGEMNLNDGEFYTSDADTSTHNRGRGRGRGEKGERDRSRSLSVTRALKKLVSMKGVVGDKKIKKKDENQYQPPVMDNIESTYDESIQFGDSELVTDNEEGLSDGGLGRRIKKKKLIKKRSDDGSEQILETSTPRSRKKKIKLGTKVDQSDGSLCISPISLAMENDSISSGIMSTPKGRNVFKKTATAEDDMLSSPTKKKKKKLSPGHSCRSMHSDEGDELGSRASVEGLSPGMLSPTKKKKKKLGLGNSTSSIRLDAEEATQGSSPGMLSPKTKKPRSSNSVVDDQTESSDPGTSMSAKMKKKKKKLKILADEVQKEVVARGDKSVEVKGMKADVQDEMKRVVQRWDSRAEMVDAPRDQSFRSQGSVLPLIQADTTKPVPNESENEKDDVLGDWLEPGDTKSKKPGRSTTSIVSDDTTGSMTPDSKGMIDEDDPWGKMGQTRVHAGNSEFNDKISPSTIQGASSTDFKVTKKRLDDFDTFATSWNGDLAKAEKDEEETVMSMAETVNSLSRQIDRYKKESRGVHKQLAESMKRIAQLTEDHRHEESRADKASNELIEIQMELSRFSDEKNDMAESLMKSKEKVLFKDQRIESLEAAVESQLDKVDFLEDKLGQTEDELFKMEGEIKYLEEISHAEARIPSDQRSSRMESIRVERMERMNHVDSAEMGSGSHRKQTSSDATLKQSRRSTHFENNGEGDIEKRVEELEIWGDELDAREKQMNVDKEYDELREKRLDEWEHDLIEKEKELAEGVISAELLPDELAEKREELEEFEKILEEERDALEFEKNELAKAREESAAMSDKNGDELQELVARLEEDIGTLKKQNKELKAAIESNKGSAEMLKEPVEHSENIRVLQAQIAEQSAEMGEENRKLTGKLTKDKAEFDQKLMLRDETITDLSETMAEMKKKLKAKDDGAYVIALLDDMNTLRKQGRENLALKDGLEESNLRLKGKEDIISILQGDLMQLNKLNPGGAQAGDNTRFKELEAELERVKLELLAGGNKDEGQLNIEIQSLKESLKNYKRKLKQEQKDTENKLERKDEAIVFMQQEMVRMKKELDKELKKVKKDKKKAGKESDDDIDLKQRIEELEDEIEHWKRVNYELEDEVSLFKTEANVWKRKAGYNQGDSTDDDDISEGSQRSISQHSISSMRSATNDPLNSSIHSISSINQSDMFYVSDKTSAGNIVTASDEPTTPSQRLARSLANLWNKPAFSGPSRPAGLYGALDDE